MPCDSRNLLEAQRQAREDAIKVIEKQIAQGKLQLKKDASGKITIEGFAQSMAARTGLQESCVLARIARAGNWVARQKLEEKLKELGTTAKAVIESHGHSH